MAKPPRVPITPNAGIDNYTLPSKNLLNNIGLGPLPSQMTGEHIDETPVLAAETSKVEDTYTEETQGSTEQKYVEPSMPYSGSVKSAVWHSRHGGAYIEVSGQRDEDEFINIVHTSGSRISMAPDGSIVIKTIGDTHNVSKGNMYEHTKGKKTQINNGGYTVSVKNGDVNIRSEGNINISSGADLNLSAAGKLNMNIGDALDLAAARVAISAREDRFDIVSKGQLSIASNKDMSLSSQGSGNMFFNTAGELTVRASGSAFLTSEENVNLSGKNILMDSSTDFSIKSETVKIGGSSKISLKSPLVAADDIIQLANGLSDSPGIAVPASEDYPAAIKPGIGKEIPKSITSKNIVPGSSGRSGATSSYDDIGE